MTSEQSSINEAAKLLKAGDRSGAYTLLKSVIQQNPRNWQAWWGLFYASTSQSEKEKALKVTLKLNPNHTKALDMLDRLRQQQAAATPPPPPIAEDPQPDWLRTTASSGASDDLIFNGPSSSGGSDYLMPADRLPDPADNSWDAMPSERVEKRKSRFNDQALNIAIVGVGVILVILIGVLAVTRLMPGSQTTNTGSVVEVPRDPNYYTDFTGGDPYRTSGGGRITVGSEITDDLYSLNEAHNWSFEGRAGQTITINVFGLDGCDPRVRLLDPRGTRIAEDDDDGDGFNAWLSYTLAEDGLYTARIDVFTTGRFTLRIE